MIRPIFGAFNQGKTPTITCINKATVNLGVDFKQLVSALQKYVNNCFAPVWNTPAKVVASTTPVAGTWTMLFIDDADVAGALGYHDLTLSGMPVSKIFVKTTIDDGQKVSVTACHELAEMLVDPGINMWAQDNDGTMYAYEVCDAVEEDEFMINGIPMSNFVYPSYFEGFRKHNSVQFDYMKKITKPFEIRPGGYSIVSTGGNIDQVFGSKEKAERFAKENRKMHRSEYRK